MRRLTFVEVHLRINIYGTVSFWGGEGAFCEGLICELAECHCWGKWVWERGESVVCLGKEFVNIYHFKI